MYTLVDCNSFYDNCEKLFRLDLRDKAVVVVSNNDGCVVARSAKAKRLGIKIGMPYFQVRAFCEQNDVTVFNSNHTLYADISHRVMSTLETLCPTVEVYSIDEAFLYLADYPTAMTDCNAYGHKFEGIVESYTGIPVYISVGSTKTMTKLANHTAKQYPVTKSVRVLDNLKSIRRIMQITDVGEVWDVGRCYKVRLNEMGIHTVYQLSICELAKIRQYFGVVLDHTYLELNGQCYIGIENVEPQKQIISSRSFSKRITCPNELSESVCSNVTKAASKLGKQDSFCSYLSVFDKSNSFIKTERYTSISFYNAYG